MTQSMWFTLDVKDSDIRASILNSNLKIFVNKYLLSETHTHT